MSVRARAAIDRQRRPAGALGTFFSHFPVHDDVDLQGNIPNVTRGLEGDVVPAEDAPAARLDLAERLREVAEVPVVPAEDGEAEDVRRVLEEGYRHLRHGDATAVIEDANVERLRDVRICLRVRLEVPEREGHGEVVRVPRILDDEIHFEPGGH